MGRPKQTKIIIKLAVNDQILEESGKGKTKENAFLDALSKFKIDKYFTKGIFTVEEKSTPLNIQQMKRMFYFGGLTSDALKIMLSKRLL